MNSKKKALIITGIVVLVVSVIVALIFYINGAKNIVETVIPDTTQPVQTTFFEENTEVTTIAATVAPETVDDIVTIDIEPLLNPVIITAGSDLSRMIYEKNEDVLTVIFDNISFYPGMKVYDITDNSEWYTVRADDMLEPGEKAYAILQNDYWDSEEFSLNGNPNVSNCEVIVWVRNYSDELQPIVNCSVYKYKISCRNGIDEYREHPVLRYMDKYGFSYVGIYPKSDNIEHVTSDSDTYVQLSYGSIDECQVLIDKFDGFGLFAITVSYNDYYGPYFGRKE